jgi:hypothetical protein
VWDVGGPVVKLAFLASPSMSSFNVSSPSEEEDELYPDLFFSYFYFYYGDECFIISFFLV